MIGQKLLCSDCYSYRANHSTILETIEAKTTDRKYIGSPDIRRCDNCSKRVPYQVALSQIRKELL